MKRRNAITAIAALSVLLLCGMGWAWMGAVGVGQGVPAATCTGQIGKTTTSTTSYYAANYILGRRIQNNLGCELTGTVKVYLYLYTYTSTNTAKVAIYSDSSGSPDALLGSSSEFDPSGYASGWYSFDVTLSSGIANNAYVWASFWGGDALSIDRLATGAEHFYYSAAYTGTFPSTMTENGTGTNDIAIYISK